MPRKITAASETTSGNCVLIWPSISAAPCQSITVLAVSNRAANLSHGNDVSLSAAAVCWTSASSLASPSMVSSDCSKVLVSFVRGLRRVHSTVGGKTAVPTLSGMRLLRCAGSVSYTHLRAHETRHDLVCRLLLEKKK